MKYESQTLDVWPNQEFIASLEVNPNTLAMGRIFTHYDRNDFFLKDQPLLENAHRLKGIPGVVLGGRFDMCTPPRSAWELSRAWPDARLEIVPVAGHRWNDEMLGRSIVAAIDGFNCGDWS
jgi:proline iminopeptidase